MSDDAIRKDARGDCGNAECNWRDPISECSYLGAVGPCCPRCREIVEPDACGVAPAAPSRRPLGCLLAMRVLQSDLYHQLDDVERADCDELVRKNLDWLKADADGVPGERK